VGVNPRDELRQGTTCDGLHPFSLEKRAPPVGRCREARIERNPRQHHQSETLHAPNIDSLAK
jgi:hypothetical protein